MVRDVDPNSTGTFNQNALCSLIARRPKKEHTLEEVIEALKIIANAGSTEDNKETTKIETDSFKSALTTSGRATGDDLRDDEVEQIIQDCNLQHDDSIVIEDLAKYLISRWLTIIFANNSSNIIITSKTLEATTHLLFPRILTV